VETVADLERRFRSTSAASGRIELAEAIAGFHDADAVRSLARLFASEKHPSVQLALLARLGDIDAEQASEVRFGVINAGLSQHSREVRSAAFDLLETMGDPASESLLEQVARNHPDKELREAAAAVLRVERQEVESSGRAAEPQ
jgi:HEAT repeat protein